MKSKFYVFACAAFFSSSCSKLVNLDIAVAEPCGQETQALNGVTSFRMLSTGAEPENVVAFTAAQPQGMSIGLGEKVIITLEAYADDITLGEDPTNPVGLTPKSVGRTVPMLIDAATQNVKATILVSKLDSFGSPRDLQGNCTEMGDNGSAVEGRHGHTVTYIPQVNKVLIFGGAVWSTEDGAPVETFLKSAELFDPTTGTFETLPTPGNARAYHTATALADGRVVIVGGFSKINGDTAPLGNGEIVDVRQENPYVSFLARVQRAHHTATLLPDVGDNGLLVIAGGCTGSIAEGCGPTSASGGSTGVVPSIELMNLSDTTTTTAASGVLGIPRAMHQAVAFNTGNSSSIAIVGGLNSTGALSGVEILQFDNGTIVNRNSTPDALDEALVRHQAVLFNAAPPQFITTGGQTQAPNGALSTAAAGTAATYVCGITDAVVTCDNFQTPLGAPRFGHAMARLRNGDFIVIGGVIPAEGAATAEALRLDSTTQAFAWGATAGQLVDGSRDRAAFTLIGGDTAAAGFVNQILYSGGHTITEPFETKNRTDIFFGP